MLVIGIDPSLTATGIAALDFESQQVTAWRAIRTDPDNKFRLKSEDLMRRALQIKTAIQDFTRQHRGIAAMEVQVSGSMGKRNENAAAKVALAYGTILGSIPGNPVLVMPTEVKRRLTGSPGSSKEQCWDACRSQLRKTPEELRSKVDREAVHDAVSVAFACRQEFEQLRSMLPVVPA